LGVYAVYIQKRESYHGAVRLFGNTYHYRTIPAQVFSDAAVALEVATAERSITSNDVEFVGWKTWGPTEGNDFDNVMREVGTFAFSGDGAAAGAMYREACLLAVWPLPRSPVYNRRRWLRKFIRLPNPTTAFSANVMAGVDPIPTATQSLINSGYIQAVESVLTGGSQAELCTELGVDRSGPGLVRPYLFTRQIGK
jgi:hypothetical protein